MREDDENRAGRRGRPRPCQAVVRNVTAGELAALLARLPKDAEVLIAHDDLGMLTDPVTHASLARKDDDASVWLMSRRSKKTNAVVLYWH